MQSAQSGLFEVMVQKKAQRNMLFTLNRIITFIAGIAYR